MVRRLNAATWQRNHVGVVPGSRADVECHQRKAAR